MTEIHPTSNNTKSPTEHDNHANQTYTPNKHHFIEVNYAKPSHQLLCDTKEVCNTRVTHLDISKYCRNEFINLLIELKRIRVKKGDENVKEKIL